MRECDPQPSPEQIIRARIASGERLTFAAFMEAALYGPGGYYTRPGRIAPGGDFYTSPAAHPAFGALVAVQLRDFWRALGSPGEFYAVELGAGDGTLARDVLAYAPGLDAPFAEALRYVAVDRPGRGADAPRGVAGCVLSNELLDALPVHRFEVAGGEVRELFVTELDGALAETPGPVSDPGIEERVRPFAEGLPEGYRGEVCLRLRAWAADVAGILERGYVLTVDYGWPREALYRPERAGGSLRCYYRHTLNQEPFRRIGSQDITAHVDFSALDEAFAGAGFRSLGLTTQAEFLGRLGLDGFVRRLRGAGLHQAAADANRMAMLELARPEGLGAFKVAVHARGVDPGHVPAGLGAGLSAAATKELPLPLLGDGGGHFDLMGGRYPESGWTTGSWDELLGGDE